MNADVAYSSESALIGACLMGRRYLEAAVATGVRAKDFVFPEFGAMYESLEGFCLFGDGDPDPVWLKAQMVPHRAFRNKAGDVEGLIVECMESCPAPANVEHYASIVRDQSKRRNVSAVAKRIAEMAESGENYEEIVELLSGEPGDEPPRLVREIERPRKSGVTSGFYGVDSATGFGLPKGQVTLVTAKTKQGKSALMLQMAVEGCRRDGIPTLWFTLADLPPEMVRDRVERHIADISELPFYVCSGKGGRTVEKICARIRHSVSNLGVGRVVIDYAQKVSTDNTKLSPLEQATRASQIIAETAEQTNCAIIVGSQITEHERGHMTKGARAWQEDAALEIVIRREPDSLELQPGRFSPGRTVHVAWNPQKLGFDEI